MKYSIFPVIFCLAFSACGPSALSVSNSGGPQIVNQSSDRGNAEHASIRLTYAARSIGYTAEYRESNSCDAIVQYDQAVILGAVPNEYWVQVEIPNSLQNGTHLSSEVYLQETDSPAYVYDIPITNNGFIKRGGKLYYDFHLTSMKLFFSYMSHPYGTLIVQFYSAGALAKTYRLPIIVRLF